MHLRFSFLPTAFLALTLLALPSRAEIKVGDVFPVLSTVGLAGGDVPATEGKVLVVDFWASWCAPCKASFPALGKIYSDYASRGVVFVGVSVDEKADAYAAFVKKQAPPFPALHDAQQKLVRTVKVPTMPSTYLIGRDGRVRSIQEGFHGATTDQHIRAELDALLADKN